MNPLLRSGANGIAIANRRQFLTRTALAAAFFTVPGAFAEALVQTPRQTE